MAEKKGAIEGKKNRKESTQENQRNERRKVGRKKRKVTHYTIINGSSCLTVCQAVH